jgi:hypothetical protein
VRAAAPFARAAVFERAAPAERAAGRTFLFAFPCVRVDLFAMSDSVDSGC